MCVLVSFLDQSFTVPLEYRSFSSFVIFASWEFFYVIINEIIFLISLSDSFFLVYKHNRLQYINFVSCSVMKFIDEL